MHIMERLRTFLRVARNRLDSPRWRLLLLASCVLVFSFAFHAKVSVYQHPTHVDGSTSSKLWLNGEKPQAISSSLPAIWLFAFLASLVFRQVQTAYESAYRAPAPVYVGRLYLQRFLRPPPRR
jgi:hypothetical protein